MQFVCRRRKREQQVIILALLAIAAYRIVLQHYYTLIRFHQPHHNNDYSQDYNDRDPPTNPIPFNFELERSLQQYMHQRRLALINESSVVQYTRVYEHFFNETIMLLKRQFEFGDEGAICPYSNETTRDDFLHIFTMDLNNHGRSDILSGMLCCAIDGFFATGAIKKHVLFSMVNSNRGEFSRHVPNRTVYRRNNNECDGHDKYYRYLNHTNVLLVVTVQHQHLDHPKVLSIPLGQQSNAAGALQKHAHPDWFLSNNRTNLLLINCDASPTRKPILQRVIANFGGNITNKKDPNRVDEYFQQLSSSKYILSPSGMGWDCYRTWEAIIMGCIPVLETYYRRDGLYRTYDDLPVLWVDHYDNVTPSLLEREYPRILSRAREYKFEKLTTQWWVDLINRHRTSERSGLEHTS